MYEHAFNTHLRKWPEVTTHATCRFYKIFAEFGHLELKTSIPFNYEKGVLEAVRRKTNKTSVLYENGNKRLFLIILIPFTKLDFSGICSWT